MNFCKNRIYLSLIVVLLCNKSFATINGDFSKPMNVHTSRIQPKKIVNKKSKKTKKQKIRKLYINFSEPIKSTNVVNNDVDHKDLNKQEQVIRPDIRTNIQIKPRPLFAQNNSNSKQNESIKPILNAEENKIGFTNQFAIGYSNSAFRYAGEEFPAKSVDFAWAPTFDTTCFTIKCNYNARILGGFDMNESGKNELALVQFGLKFPQDPWGGYLTPSYHMRGFLPATPKEINKDNMLYGYGAAFILETTPELLGTEFITITTALSLRKDVQEADKLTNQRNWMGREALLFDFKFTDSIFATVLFGHIFNEYYDHSNNDILELIQMIKWQANDWLDLNISHSNTRPTYLGESAQLDNRVIDVDNSIVSFGIGITNKF